MRIAAPPDESGEPPARRRFRTTISERGRIRIRESLCLRRGRLELILVCTVDGCLAMITRTFARQDDLVTASCDPAQRTSNRTHDSAVEQ